MTLAYAPNLDEPSDMNSQMRGRGKTLLKSEFSHPVVVAKLTQLVDMSRLRQGIHFFDRSAVEQRGMKAKPSGQIYWII